MFLQKFAPSRLEAYASPFVVVGAAAILALVVIALAVYNVNRETRLTSTILTEKGAVLVRTFEAGTRAGMMGMWGPEQRIQILAEQFAMLPGITAITLTNDQGRILADNDSERIGLQFLEEQDFKELAPSETLQWKVMRTPQGGRAFLVYKLFTPLPPGGRGFGRGRMGGDFPGHGPRLEHMRENWRRFRSMLGEEVDPQHPPRPEFNGPEALDENAPFPKTVLFISMDVTPFEEARAQDVRTTILLAATLLALGLGGFVALYWAQRLRASRRMLRDTRAFADEVIAHMPMGLVAMDPEGRITMINNTAESVLGHVCSLKAGERYKDCLPQALVAILERVEQGEEIVEQELSLNPGGLDDSGLAPIKAGALPLSVSGARILVEEGRSVGAILLLRDLRELKRLEAAVRRAEKLAAVGNLAAGVAHEIRNPLSSIKASATYFGAQFARDSDGKRMAEIMIQEVERLNRAVTQLLEYARPSRLKAREVELLPLVERSLELVRRDAQAQGVKIALDAADAPVSAWLDPDRFTQALLNLLINAIQAMEQGGELSVRLERVENDAFRVTVEDTGPGLPSDDVRRIFDPYFTTKARGTGLGLAIVQKIVEAHQGEVGVWNVPGRGARFSITLPLRPGRNALENEEENGS